MLKVKAFGLSFKNPVIAASGTFGFGHCYDRYYDPSILGGISGKGVTFFPKAGNTGLRIAETPSGMMNSIGLENPGVAEFLLHELPAAKDIDSHFLVNLGGADLDQYVQGAQLIEAHHQKALEDSTMRDIQAIELNISCPNVKEGGIAFGITCQSAAVVVREVRKVTSLPLIVKLSPNAENIMKVAQTCQEEGADGIALINTISSLHVDVYNRKATFDNIYAGLSGPAIMPIALKMVREVSKSITIPVIGMGGITTAEDVMAFIMVGADLVQFGTASFMNPMAGKELVEGIQTFMVEQKIGSLDEIRGII